MDALLSEARLVRGQLIAALRHLDRLLAASDRTGPMSDEVRAAAERVADLNARAQEFIEEGGKP